MSVDEVEPIEAEAAEENAVAPLGTHLASTQTVTHEYLTQSGKVMRETIKTNQTVTAVMDFVYDESGKPFAMIDQLSAQPNTYYYVLNLQGDVVKLVTESGAVAASYEYDAWGNILASSGSMAETNPLRYRGYYYDSETGFYYLQSRYYDPATRRFINADVYTSTDSGDAISCNMFAYCNNNPIIRKDPSGESFLLTIAIIGTCMLIGGAAGAIDAAASGEDAMEGFIEGTINTGISAGFALAPMNPIAAVICATAASGVVDVAVQAVSQYTKTGTVQVEKINFTRTFKTMFQTCIGTLIPKIGAATKDLVDAVGTTILWGEGSILVACADIAITKSIERYKASRNKLKMEEK